MTGTNSNNNYPKLLTFSKKESNIKFIVHGQGVFIFKNLVLKNLDDPNECFFRVYDKNQTDGLNIKITSTNVVVNYISNDEPLVDEDNNQGLSTDANAYYWFSLDSQNQKIYVGIGEARTETIIYEYQFEKTEINKKFLENLVNIQISKSMQLIPIKLLRDPITTTVPLLIKNTNELTMDDIADNKYFPNSSLSSTSQKLYNCISGNNFILNTGDFPEFSKAIEYSIITPGCWCYEKLKSKSTEFNPDKPNLLETYLRITLGQNNGESPGIPYVMEIWPPQHYSPIHNHGDSSAVIRVLHGSINVSLFPYLSHSAEPFGIVDFEKDDITWISPSLNQVHQLKNTDNENTCVTIQCYMYESENTVHYDYFDYLDDDGKKQQYEPDSDMDFIDFKQTIKQEWNARTKSVKSLSWSAYILKQFCLI
jgi:hypothetical protein